MFKQWFIDRVCVAKSTHISNFNASYFNCSRIDFPWYTSPLDERCHSIDGDCFLKKNQLSCNLPMPKKIPKIPK